MFICEKCKKICGPKVSPEKVVLKVRDVEHPRREYLLHGEKVYDPGGKGTQIVEAQSWCPECAKEKK